MLMAPPEVSAPYLDDSGENQLWEANAVGLAMEILQHQVIELVNESVLSRRNTNQEAGLQPEPDRFPTATKPYGFPRLGKASPAFGDRTWSTFLVLCWSQGIQALLEAEVPLTLKAFSCRLALESFRITAKLMGLELIRPGFLLKSTCWKTCKRKKNECKGDHSTKQPPHDSAKSMQWWQSQEDNPETPIPDRSFPKNPSQGHGGSKHQPHLKLWRPGCERC